jgi:hypothetical protein
MQVTITVKLQAQSKGELIDTFGDSVRKYCKHFDVLKKQGTFGMPDDVELRYLVVGGKWKPKEGSSDQG